MQIRTDDNLPKAICHDCLQQVSIMHLFSVKVEKTQKFLGFHKLKAIEERRSAQPTPEPKPHPLISVLQARSPPELNKKPVSPNATEFQQGDVKETKPKITKKKTPSDMKFLEAMPLDEFVKEEKLDKSLLSSSSSPIDKPNDIKKRKSPVKVESKDLTSETLDPIVLIDGKPAKQGAALDKQITLFYKMECCICHENGFHFRSLMKHYKDRHGVPGYVTCCEKKFHYFYPKKIIEHMAFHLQPNIFM